MTHLVRVKNPAKSKFLDPLRTCGILFIYTVVEQPTNPLRTRTKRSGVTKMETEMIDQELPGKLEIKIVSRPSSQAQRIWRKRGRPRDLRSQAGFQPIAAHLIAVSLITPNTQ